MRLTVPLIEYVPCGAESAIEPRNAPFACLQWMTKVPRCDPLYVPDHLPPSPAGDDVVADAIEAVAQAARDRGAARFYWQTKEDNATARALYDKLARFRGFIRYDYPLDGA